MECSTMGLDKSILSTGADSLHRFASLFFLIVLCGLTVMAFSQGKPSADARAIADLCAAGDANAIAARFDADMAKAVSVDRLKQIFENLRGTAPIGKRLSESERKQDGIPVYEAVYAWGDGKIAITVTIDSSGKVSGLLLKPVKTPSLGPDPRAEYKTKAILRLPFNGEWFIFWGGDTREQNYHVDYPSQRHAYDIVIRRGGATHKGTGSSNDNYYAFGQPVLAPAEATVVRAVDGIADNKPGVMNTVRIFGNHVVLDLGNNEYAVICHFKNGSLRVKPGDHVQVGQVIGLCGNTGNSSEPHIHFHLQDGKTPGNAIGLPAPFTNYIADGKKVSLGVPVRGQIVKNATP
jgi:murein DD-endopeptidase MepM/ murein hydrolase activator NlpD